MRGAGFHLRAMALAMAVGLLPAGVFVPGCAKKEGLVEPAPQPPLPAGVIVDGNVVRWRTDVASLGSVRFHAGHGMPGRQQARRDAGSH